MPYFDGHLHSTASDGQLAPEALVDTVRAAGVRVMALTDHDSFAGHEAARARAAAVGMELVPGVEMSVELDGRELHILAYFVDAAATGLARALDEARAERRRHLAAALARLAELGYVLTEAEVLAEVHAAPGVDDNTVGRPHIARALVRKGRFQSFRQVFDELLGNGKPGHVKRRMPSAERMVALAREAGGVCSAAHPGTYDLQAADFDRLAAIGVAGVEVYHPDHARDDEVYFLRECHRLDLVPTGGSDFHGALDRRLRQGQPGLDEAGYQRLLARRGSPPQSSRERRIP